MRMHTVISHNRRSFSPANLRPSSLPPSSLPISTTSNNQAATKSDITDKTPLGKNIAILTWDDTLDAKQCAFAIADSMNHFSNTHLFSTKIFLAHQHCQRHHKLKPLSCLPLALSSSLRGFDYMIMLIDQHAIDVYPTITKRYVEIGQDYHKDNNNIIIVDCTEQPHTPSQLTQIFTDMSIPFIKPPQMLSIALSSKALRLPALALLGGWVLEK